jgi:hypothetical protein
VSPSTLPTLTPQDAALLEDFLALSLDPNALAAKHNRPVAPLLDWAQSAAIAPYIDAYMSLFSRALQVRQIDALKKLSELSNTSPDPIEQRRAATTVVRICQQVLHPRTNRAPRAPEPTRHAPEPPPPPRASIREPAHDPALPAAEQPRTPHTLVTPALTDVLMALRDPLTSFDPLVPSVPPVTSVSLVPALSPSPKRTAASRLITTAGLPHSRAP